MWLEIWRMYHVRQTNNDFSLSLCYQKSDNLLYLALRLCNFSKKKGYQIAASTALYTRGLKLKAYAGRKNNSGISGGPHANFTCMSQTIFCWTLNTPSQMLSTWYYNALGRSLALRYKHLQPSFSFITNRYAGTFLWTYKSWYAICVITRYCLIISAT